MQDRPMARPMAYQDSFAQKSFDPADLACQPLLSVNPDDQEQADRNEDSDVYEGWIPTPPRPVDHNDPKDKSTIDPLLTSMLASPVTPYLHLSHDGGSNPTLIWTNGNTSVDQEVDISSSTNCGAYTSRRRSSTPSTSHTSLKRPRVTLKSERKASLFVNDSPELGNGRDMFGFKALIGQMPTKQEREESDEKASISQERLTSRITEQVTNVISANGALDIANKRELALEEM